MKGAKDATTSVKGGGLGADRVGSSAMTTATTAMDRAAIRYRLPMPGAHVTGGRLEANAPVAGLAIQYRTGTAAWRRYEGPVAVSGKTELRTVSPDGRRFSLAVSVN